MKNHNNLPAMDDISFVIQGKLNRETTPLAIQNIRRIFPKAEIVLSSYTGTNATGLDYDKAVWNEDPGAFYHDDGSCSKENNINRQIRTTLEGLRAATRRYAFKLRTDFILTDRGFIDFFDQFPESDPQYRIFEHKILSCVFFARDPRMKNSQPFHPSDIAFFGLRGDLIKLFDVPFMTREESVFYREGRKRHCRYTPEQHLWIACLRESGKKIDCEYQRDTSAQVMEETERYAVSNFIYLDWRQFNLTPPKKFIVFDDNFVTCTTHIEWQKLYKRYLDSALAVPEHDELRDFISQGLPIFKKYERIAKICTIFILIRALRRKLRIKITQYFTRHLSLKALWHFPH